MMNGHEKSDPAIVAMKLTKKAEPSVERSAGEPYAASRWSKGQGPRGMRASKARAGREGINQRRETSCLVGNATATDS
jgi:hypothetical protein